MPVFWKQSDKTMESRHVSMSLEKNDVELVKEEILYKCHSCKKEFGSQIIETLLTQEERALPSCQKETAKYLKYFCIQCARHERVGDMPLFRCDLCNEGLGFCVIPEDTSKIIEIPNTPDSESVKFQIVCMKCRLTVA